MIEFESWPKTSRLNSEVIITEKIDRSNCAVIIEADSYGGYIIGAQSRNRLLTLENDHQGFAQWVQDNHVVLYSLLGPGRHFGEWTTKGLKRPKFFLFNTKRWLGVNSTPSGRFIGLDCVPVL